MPHLIRLWVDDGIQKCFSLRGKFQLGESVRYYMQNIDRIKVLDYEPTQVHFRLQVEIDILDEFIQDDILWARKRTEDITETRVPIKRVPFSFIDVGGQRAQRAKWFQCFQESINTILFFVSISEYDQTLVEDTNQNRVIEALKVRLNLFICLFINNLRCFNTSSVTLHFVIVTSYYFSIKMTY